MELSRVLKYRFRELHGVDTIEEIQKLTDKQITQVGGVGKMFLHRLRELQLQERNLMTIPTRMFCQICGHVHKIDFWVPNEIWDEAIHPRWKHGPVCINCFMERADERLLFWDKHI
jgi:hypothetical protein